MTLRIGACARAVDRMPAAVRGRLTVLERLDLEAHVGRCARCADVLRDTRVTVTALQRAYGSMRATRAPIAPARVRAAVRWTPAAPARSPFSVIARLAEASLAASLAVFLLGGANIAPPEAVDDGHREGIRVRVTANFDDQERFLRSLRIGRTSPMNDMVDGSLVVVTATRHAPDDGTISLVKRSSSLD